jgi:hypothetical protein
LGPYVSSATISIPNFGANCFRASRPLIPYPVETLRIATFLMPLPFMNRYMSSTARSSPGTTLKIHFLLSTGDVIFRLAAWATRGIFAAVTMGISAMEVPLVLGPIMATTLSF